MGIFTVFITCNAIALAMLVPSALGQTEVAEQLLAGLRSQWPKQGSLIVEFRNDPGGQEIHGYDFASGAWFVDRRHDGASSDVYGIDPSGVAYKGTMPGKKIIEDANTGLSSGLDKSFPGIYLEAVLRWPGALQNAVQTSDGGWDLSFSLPRGNRSRAIDELPETELERWGGAKNVNRIVTVRIDASYQVLSIQRPNLVLKEYDRADCSPGGFQVSSHWPAPLEKYILTRCKFSGSPATAAFAMDEVIRVGTERRMSVKERTPVPSLDPEGPRPVPIRTTTRPEIGLSPKVLIWGGVLVAALGVFAWFKRRAA